MDLDLTPEQELLRDTVRSFARERIAPVAEEIDRESRFPVELCLLYTSPSPRD